MYKLQTEYFESDYAYPIKEKYDQGGRISLADYQDSFNMIIGTTNNTMDWFDNPYIQIKVYDLSQDWQPKPSTRTKLVKCKLDQMSSFINDNAMKYYPNSLCFEDIDTIPM